MCFFFERKQETDINSTLEESAHMMCCCCGFFLFLKRVILIMNVCSRLAEPSSVHFLPAKKLCCEQINRFAANRWRGTRVGGPGEAVLRSAIVLGQLHTRLRGFLATAIQTVLRYNKSSSNSNSSLFILFPFIISLRFVDIFRLPLQFYSAFTQMSC